VTRTPSNGSRVYWSRDADRVNTALPYFLIVIQFFNILYTFGMPLGSTLIICKISNMYCNFKLRNCKEKMKGGRLKANHFSSWSRRYLVFLSREIDIKLCQIYTKIHIYIYNFVKTDRDTWPLYALPLVGVLVTWSERINNIFKYIY